MALNLGMSILVAGKIRPFPVGTDIRDGLARGMVGLIEVDEQFASSGEILNVLRDSKERIFSHIAKLEGRR